MTKTEAVVLLPHQTFHYADRDIEFVADPGDIRSCAVFFDETIRGWCAGIAVKESYTKLRFRDEGDARKFSAEVARQKEAFAHRQAHNAAQKAAGRIAGAAA